MTLKFNVEKKISFKFQRMLRPKCCGEPLEYFHFHNKCFHGTKTEQSVLNAVAGYIYLSLRKLNQSQVKEQGKNLKSDNA